MLVSFLLPNSDVFAWKASDLSGVPREVIEHHLAVCPNACPIKQKARRQAPKKQDFIVKEVQKLQEAGVIREVRHPEWLANPGVVPKKGDKERMAAEDVERMAFITPCGIYCYVCMPFGLRSAGATFQRLMRIMLGPQMGMNAEAYVDDIVVKSHEAGSLI